MLPGRGSHCRSSSTLKTPRGSLASRVARYQTRAFWIQFKDYAAASVCVDLARFRCLLFWFGSYSSPVRRAVQCDLSIP
eukprot:2822814-Prymnesium_polylepis.2